MFSGQDYSGSDHVDGLILHAHDLAAQSRERLECGDFDGSIALLEQAELLAGDITQTVDELEQRHGVPMLGLSGPEFAAQTFEPDDRLAGGLSSWRRALSALRRNSLGIGAGIALGALVTEC